MEPMEPRTTDATTQVFVHDGSQGSNKPLSERALEEILEKLKSVSRSIEGLRLPHNKLTSLSAYGLVNSINWFPMLTHLDLSCNNLGYVGASSVAQAVQSSETLTWLSLTGNNIAGKDWAGLMELLFGPKSHLRQIDLSDNKLGNEGAQALALWLPVNVTLVELRLQLCHIGDSGMLALFAGFGGNCFLEQVQLLKNPVNKLWTSKACLEQVNATLFRNVSLVLMEFPDVPHTMQERLLMKRHQNLTVQKCPDLGYFSDRHWTSIPMPVFARDSLTKLDVSMNRLVGLPYAILELINLEYLNIANNWIDVTGVPVHCRDLPMLKTLRVEGNPFLSFVPERYDTRKLDDLLLFFDFFCESALSGVEIKMVILGASRAGKSRFAKTLAAAAPGPAGHAKVRKRSFGIKSVGQSDSSASLHHNIDPLEGPSQVSVTQVMLPLPDRGAKLNVWDFSVEPDVESHPMVQFYLSDGAFYCILVSPSNNDWRESLLYWKNMIEGRVVDAEIFFIVTHKDRPGSQASHIAQEIQRDFVEPSKNARGKARSVRCHGVWTVSSSPKDVVPVLERMALIANPRVTEIGKLPVPWTILESMLAEEEKVVSFPLVPYARFEAMALACGALETEIAEIGRYLHGNGSILHYSGIRKLQNVVIISPPWLLRVASRLLQFGDRGGSTSGTFQLEDLPTIWPPYAFPPRSLKPILQLLEAFEVLNPLGRVFVMPFLVPDKAPKEEDWPLNRVVMGTRYRRVYSFLGGSVPRTLMAQLIIRLLEISSRAFSIWQSGVIFSIKERTFLHMIVVRLDREVNDLLIDVSSKDSGGKVLHILHSTIESVLDGWYKNLEYQCYAIGHDGVRVSLDELAKLAMQMKAKVNVVVGEDLAPDILMKTTSRVNFADVHEGDFIAAGAFGSVSKGQLKGRDIVVKRMITLEQMSEPEVYQSFLKECWVMSFLRHDCIIQMEGISLEPLCMILEYMNLRDLRHFLDHYELPPWSLRLKIITDLARGMAYAHEQFPAIVHRDFKSPNCFLALHDGVLVAKVADLGLATVLPRLIKNAVVENPTWSAPEVIMREPYSQPADVYSFGIVMWELLTGRFPFGELWNRTQFTTEIIARISEGTRPTIRKADKEGVPAGYLALMKSAWSHNEEERPSFNQVTQGLAVITRSFFDTAKPLRAVGKADAAGAGAAAAAAEKVGAESADAACAADAAAASAGSMPLSPSRKEGSKSSLLFLHRLPRVWGGLACLTDDSKVFTLRAEGEFDVTDLRTDSLMVFRHSATDFSLRHAEMAATSHGVWVVDGVCNEVLILEATGRSTVLTCQEVDQISSVLPVNDQVWTAGQVDEASPQEMTSLLYVWSPQKLTRKPLANVKGVLRHGIAASNNSVYFNCSRSEKREYLWRMRLSDKKCAKFLLPSAAWCLIDVLHLAEIWAVCVESHCVVRVSYDLKELGRFSTGQNVFCSGIYIPRLHVVASIGTANMCMWDCETFLPLQIRKIASDDASISTARLDQLEMVPHLVLASAFGQIVVATAERMLLASVEIVAPVPFHPEPRQEKERNPSRVELRERATRSMIRTFETTTKSRSNSESSETNAVENRHNFATATTGGYNDKSRPMGLRDLLKVSSSEDVFSDDAMQKLNASRELRQRVLRSQSITNSDESASVDESREHSSGKDISGDLLSVKPALRPRSNSAAPPPTPAVPGASLSQSPVVPRRRSSLTERNSSNGALPSVNRSPVARSPRQGSAGVLSPRSPRRSGGSTPSRSPRGRAVNSLVSPRKMVPSPRPHDAARKLERTGSVVVERMALREDGGGLKLFQYQRRSGAEMSPLESQLSSGRVPQLEARKSRAELPSTVVIDSSFDSDSPVGSLNSNNNNNNNVHVGSTGSSAGSASPATAHVTGSGGEDQPEHLSNSGGSSSSARRTRFGTKGKERSLGASSSSSMASSSKNAGQPVGLLGLVDDQTVEKLYSDDAPRKMRTASKIKRRLQRDDPPSRRMSSASVNIGGVSMKVQDSPALVPKLQMSDKHAPQPTAPVPVKSGRVSPKFGWKNKKRSIDVSSEMDSDPSSGGRPSTAAPLTPPGGATSPLHASLLLSPQSAGRRSRSSTVTGAEGASSAKYRPRSHSRARSIGGSQAGEDDPEVKEIRALLTARLGNGVQAMKGRSGSVSGPTSVRGVNKSQIQLRRHLQGEMSPMMSPPSSDESREGYSPMRSPLASPKDNSGVPLNLINAAQVEAMYAKRAQPPRKDSSSSGGLTSPIMRKDSATGLSSPGKPKTPSSEGSSLKSTELGSRASKSKLPRALSKISGLFKGSSSRSESNSPGTSPATKPEIHTQLERHGSTVGPEVDKALLRVSVLAEGQKGRHGADVPDEDKMAAAAKKRNTEVEGGRAAKSAEPNKDEMGASIRVSRGLSLGSEFDDTAVDDSSGTSNSARKE